MADAPILVQFEYHTASKEASKLAMELHNALNDDPAVPGLRIPTLFTPCDGTKRVPEPQLDVEADRVLVVLLADDNLAADAHRPISGDRWVDYVVRLHEHCEQDDRYRFMPVQLTPNAWPIDERLKHLSFLRAWVFDGDKAKQREFVARHIIQLLLRCLKPDPSERDGPPVTIFLSHTKIDLEAKPKAVKALLAHLTADQPQKTWFDSGDIEVGSRFAEQIEAGVKDAALLVVLTDAYSSRSWCRREVLLAKRFQRPVVVVQALNKGEVRSFPYIGNVPVVRWRGNAQEVIDLLLREALRHAVATESLERRKRPDDVVLPSPPELLTLVHRQPEQVILYPDPPLGAEELDIIKKTGVSLKTPLERHAEEHSLSEKSLTVALSASPGEDIACFGLRPTHLDAALLELSRYLLLSGIRLAYGGTLGSKHYTTRLADLLRDPLLEHLRDTAGDPNTKAVAQLVNYLPWPAFETVKAQARLHSRVELIACRRPGDVDETLDSILTDPITREVPHDTQEHRFAWARGLTDMRTRQVNEVSARIVLGGRLGTELNPYRGRMPGVLEEVLLSIDAKQPVYLVGAYGGCARLLSEALQGRQHSQLTSEHYDNMPWVAELKVVYERKGIPWPDYDRFYERLKSEGFDLLCNGLSPADNLKLSVTRSTERMIELIISGLQEVYAKKHGDVDDNV